MNSSGVLFSIFLLVSFLTGCATNQMTGRSQLMLVSEDAAIARSVSAYSRMVGELQKNGKLSTDTALVARVHEITNRLITQAVRYRPETKKWQWSMEIIDDPKTVNAFCMAGGKMAIFTGLIEKIQPTDDELAQVIGHEIAHALASHSAEKMSVALAADLGVTAIAAAAARNERQRRGIHSAGAFAAMAIVKLPNSRQAETEADRLGIELAARAGYEPQAAVTLWEKMMRQTGDRNRGDFFSTHPSAPNRISALSELASPMTEIYREGLAHLSANTYAWIGKGSNERLVAPDGKSSTDIAPLTFYTPEYDAFEKGGAALTCASECNANFFVKRSALKKEYEAKNWRVLATETVKLNYKLDLSYFYLAAAAKGLGLPTAAQNYSEEARKLAETEDYACARRTFTGCDGIDVRKQLDRSDAVGK